MQYVLRNTLALAIALVGASALPAHSRAGSYGAAPATVAAAVSEPMGLFWFAPPVETKTQPPRINSVAFGPGTPGVGLASTFDAEGSIMSTTDHGITWSTLASWGGTPGYNFHVVSGEQPGVYYAWSSQSVHTTTSNGDAWSQLAYPEDCGSLATLVVHPVQPSTLYIATSFGFAWSANGGQSWDNCVMEGPRASTIGVGVAQPDVVYAGLSYNYGGGVWRSPDRGKNWDVVSTGLPKTEGNVNTVSIIQVIVDPTNTDRVVALTDFGTVYATTNAGGQWSPLDQGIGSVRLRWLAAGSASAALYGISDDHLYVLDSASQSWQIRPGPAIPQPASFPSAPRFTLDPNDPNRFIAYHEYGIYVGLPVRGSALLPLIARP
jgi:hypothetical protein